MKLITSFKLGLSYNLVSIFNHCLEYPLNDWLPENTGQ
jgi:hypothetical protein